MLLNYLYCLECGGDEVRSERYEISLAWSTPPLAPLLGTLLRPRLLALLLLSLLRPALDPPALPPTNLKEDPPEDSTTMLDESGARWIVLVMLECKGVGTGRI